MIQGDNSYFKIKRYVFKKVNNNNNNNNNNIILNQTLSSLYLPVPHPSQSQSTIYDHQYTLLLLRLLFLPINGQLSYYCISSRSGKVKIFVGIVRNTFRLGITGIFGIPNKILRDTETEIIKPLIQRLSRDERDC